MPTLTWLTREDDLKRAGAAPYRLLEEVPALGAGDRDAGNMLIQGDNLDALKALLPYYAGRVKCIYIDPPYNTRSAFEHYDDNLQHAEWLAMIYPRLELLRELLSEDGSIWVSIDDNEGHYLKVIMDEVFGRSSFVANVVWQKRYSRDNNSAFGNSHDHIMVYSMNYEAFKNARNRLPLDEKSKRPYRNDFGDGRGLWRPVPMHGEGYRPNQMYPIVSPGGATHYPPEGRHWAVIESRYKELLASGRIYFGKDGNSQPNTIRFLTEVDGLTPWTWWPQEEVGHNDEAKKEGHAFFGKTGFFGTPKPERLIHRIVQIATKPGDLVLDSFLGSGTTAAVAHKMGRRFIGVEMGDHAVTHCAPRLGKVIDGEQGGISESVGWKGGGGFRFYRLGAPVFDSDGAINPGIPFRHLAAHVWFSETGTPLESDATGPWLGAVDGRGLALLYNGILGDKSVSGGNVLTAALLKRLRGDSGGFAGPMTIYGEASRLGPDRLTAEGVTFKQTPYDVRARSMDLTPYQTAALDRLGAFLERAKLTGAATAYAHVTDGDAAVRPYVSAYRVLEGLPDVPYCCVRLPTGGGKTLLGAHSIKIAADRFVERERPLVLWLTPSKTIADQTVAALKHPDHPYRQALDDAFGGRVRVLDISERRLVRPQDLAESVVIFVGTHQSFNVAEPGDRNVYADDEAYEPHFRGALPADLATNPDGPRAGQVANSFANLLKWHRPVLILDEAHNFVSKLSGEVKQRLNPACVIEFTATPKPASNTIFNASARALRDADMIKLPILLTAHQTWEAAVGGALAERRGLAAKAVAEGGRYIRPITLFQAQPATAGALVTVETLKAHLIENERIDPATIAVATGDTRELDGINLLDPSSKIEHVITVAALKEGWDCSFAYVFCSLANIGSEGAVEQLLGRVLRQPYAERRADAALNQAYAHVSSPIFARTAEALKDQLVRMGFDAPGEAAALIVQQEANLPGGGINREPVAFAVVLDTPINVADLSIEAQRVVRIEPRADGGAVLHIAPEATPAVAALVAAVVAKSEASGKAKAGAILEWQAVNDARRAPAGLGVKFAPVPHFMAKVQGEIELADADSFINLAGWKLGDASTRLEPVDFDYDETAQTFRFDLDGERLSYTMAARGPELPLDYGAAFDAVTLASWLTNSLDQRDRWHSTHSALLEFNRLAVEDLLGRRAMPLGTLVRGRYLLKRTVEQRIRASRTAAAVRGMTMLFGVPDDVVVAPDHAFGFDASINPGTGFYEGAWTPTKHYYARAGQMNGEEVECAQQLDALPAVRHWVRNGDKGKHCFSLPTSTDRFHPDFVAELTDGRVLVVEYKGADRLNADTAEKNTIGLHWAARSGGRCRFVTVTKAAGMPSILQQLTAALAD